MGIVGCYSLDLYCDNTEAHKGEFNDGLWEALKWETIGRSRAECFRKAKKAGWSIDLRNHLARCPRCKGGRIRESEMNNE